MPCWGTCEKTCCRVKGEDCPNLIYNYTDENGHFRRFACGLYAELGDWDKVLKDPRYPGEVWAKGINCRDWPEKPAKYRGCNLCGEAMD